MAITKTIPPPVMTVGDYRCAAIRHLKTCDVLFSHVNHLGASPQEIDLKNEILRNVFYLLGYVNECAIKYRYLTECFALTDGDDETVWISRGINVKFHLVFDSSTGNAKHKTRSEKTIQDIVSTATHIFPLYMLNLGNSLLPSTVEEDMMASWEPAIRYVYTVNGLPNPPHQLNIELLHSATKMLLRNLFII